MFKEICYILVCLNKTLKNTKEMPNSAAHS